MIDAMYAPTGWGWPTAPAWPWPAPPQVQPTGASGWYGPAPMPQQAPTPQPMPYPLVLPVPMAGPITVSNTVFYETGLIAAMNIGQWTYGVGLLTGEKPKLNAGDLLRTPFVVATLVGLALFFTQLQLPGIVTECLDFVSALNTPLAMFGIGVYLAHVDFRQMVRNTALLRVCAVRLLVIPLAVLLLLAPLPASMNSLRLALLIAQACPVGSNVAVYAQLHNADYAYGVQTVVASVLLSVVTIPAVVALAQLVW